jgi:hypothetical protein
MWVEITSSSHTGGDLMTRAFTFGPLQQISMTCACGSMDGHIELMNWGIRIHFECNDCDSRVSMDVKNL